MPLELCVSEQQVVGVERLFATPAPLENIALVDKSEKMETQRHPRPPDPPTKPLGSRELERTEKLEAIQATWLVKAENSNPPRPLGSRNS